MQSLATETARLKSLNLDANLEPRTVEGFGAEWAEFDQSEIEPEELLTLFQQYFSIFPFDKLDSETSVGADFGCGSGRWSKILARRCRYLHLIDASKAALETAKANLKEIENVSFHCCSIEHSSLAPNSLDFAVSLGVLHHLPDTQKALCDISAFLKPGGVFLVYLYYALEQKPLWFRALWQISDFLRRRISLLSFERRKQLTQIIAAFVYWPLAKTAHILESLGFSVEMIPLSYYRNRSFYVMKNDALDRFGTYLEKRFNQNEIRMMLLNAGFENIEFSSSAPYWRAIATKSGLRK